MIYTYLDGRLGNCLFEIAAGASLAKRMNVPFKALTCSSIYIPEYVIEMSEYVEPFRQSILRNIDFSDEYPKNQKIYQVPDFSYQPLPEEKDLLLKGYFQSEKYFDEELVRGLFSIDTEMAAYLHNKYGHVLARNPVSIQVRRGDYFKCQHVYPICQMSYYKKAMSNFPPDTVFLVMSDDMDWCRKHFRGTNFFFSDAESPVIDLYLQSFCKHNIISNSSFGWWGAWLNPDREKKVIYPTPWFTPLSGINAEDLCPATWIKEPIAGRMSLFVRSHYYWAMDEIGRYFKLIRKII
ncbi:alpha-1,2-fucosyltransferase [Parabacteroides bouchesdurhonensis]|uniref:alpha-1,2-fucosyltransferase n=1 Tax=Parabacteroides bouchesdurhonensis TaxID=1936995 RepID=UPI000C843FE6|nr:alpha-1,2-fucosyltransferase [Parabacteroides bouchesdurhonensis]